MLDSWFLLIFGGCCSNVFALEAIIKHEPDSGLLITALQFAVTAVFALPSQLTFSSKAAGDAPSFSTHAFPRLRTPTLPMRSLLTISVLFFAVNMLNNWAFAFDISVPMHIILRSFGSVQTLAVGYLAGRRYSSVQVASVLALSAGVLVSAWADASAKGAKLDLAALSPFANKAASTANSSSANSSDAASSSFVGGILVLFSAQLISAWMGVYSEATYAAHGRAWREVLFYTHAFGLLLSAAFAGTVRSQLRRAATGPRADLRALAAVLPARGVAAVTGRGLSLPPAWGLDKRLGQWDGPSRSVLLLAVNALTQVACIGGVNRLSAMTTAVTVTVVLNVRKLISFLLSCVVFGNPVSRTMALGAAIVFASGAVYGWDSSRQRGGKAKEKVGGGTAKVDAKKSQ